MEQNRLLKEHELRVQAEMERDRYKAEIGILTEQLAAMQVIIYYYNSKFCCCKV